MIIPEFYRTQKFLYEVDELRAISGYMLGASKVQIPENNLDNLHSIIKDGTLEIVDPQELLGSFSLATNDLLILDLLTGTVFLASLDFLDYTNVTTGLDALLSIGTGFLRGTIAVVVILVKGHTFLTNEKVLPVDLRSEFTFDLEFDTDEMALVSTILFFLFKLGCDPLALESKFAPLEESTGIQKALTKEMKETFEELEAEVDQNAVNRKCDAIERKIFSLQMII
uniref:Uncharacterized protein n=1 Tax=Tanacetum cinerariifolium TaxID=118510 RepID=A0A6L2LY57_TANCI|nr:hypothetical protein [Tanacetum cinerariifolium]